MPRKLDPVTPHRRCIHIPAELGKRLEAVGDRVNVSAAACSGIEAMVRVAEADPDFRMARRGGA